MEPRWGRDGAEAGALGERTKAAARRVCSASTWALPGAFPEPSRTLPTRRLRDELCVLSLDAPPAPSLARLYGAWGVPDETAALAQVTILLTPSSSSPSPSPPASTTASASALLSAPLLCRLRRAERCPARDGAGDG